MVWTKPLLSGMRKGDWGVVVESKDDSMWVRIGGRREEALRCASEPVSARTWFTISIGLGAWACWLVVSGMIDASWAAILMVTGMMGEGEVGYCQMLRF